MNKYIEIFTDGSCFGNPGPGGYGVILRYKKHEKILTSGYRLTTNNRMELMAAIVALQELQYPCNIILHTDSRYLHQGITKWLHNWKYYGWKTTNKHIIKNIDLWRKLDKLIEIHNLHWNWIKGHSGHNENERCDKLARTAAKTFIFEDYGYVNIL